MCLGAGELGDGRTRRGRPVKAIRYQGIVAILPGGSHSSCPSDRAPPIGFFGMRQRKHSHNPESAIAAQGTRGLAALVGVPGIGVKKSGAAGAARKVEIIVEANAAGDASLRSRPTRCRVTPGKPARELPG
jgi:hypothetical protein